jgi:hypothetical protein
MRRIAFLQRFLRGWLLAAQVLIVSAYTAMTLLDIFPAIGNL